jgi:hypothetical protein
MDEDVHMEILPQCVDRPPTMDGPQPTQQQPKDHPMEQHDMVGTQIVQKVVSIMDKFLMIPKSLLGTFEGNGDDEPLIATMETQDIENDFRVDVATLALGPGPKTKGL